MYITGIQGIGKSAALFSAVAQLQYKPSESGKIFGILHVPNSNTLYSNLYKKTINLFTWTVDKIGLPENTKVVSRILIHQDSKIIINQAIADYCEHAECEQDDIGVIPLSYLDLLNQVF